MDEIKALFSVPYPTIIMGLFIVILGVDKIVYLFSRVKKTLRIKFGFEEDKETIEYRIAVLEEHDKWQYEEISKISKGIDEIKDTLIQKEKNDNAKTVATLRGQLYGLYEKFVSKGYIDQSGIKTFTELGKIYESAGGDDIFHDKLYPEIMALPIKDR